MQKLLIEGIRTYACHGVLPEEQMIGGEYITDLSFEGDFARAIETDDLRHAVDYEKAAGIVKAEMMQPSKLIEHVAGRILKSLKKEFPSVKAVEVKVAKLRPPVNGIVGKAVIIIRE